MIEDSRIRPLNKHDPAQGEYILYWMQASQRAEQNHALEFAVSKANELKQPILVYFGLTDSFPEANERHYYFMLEGLRETQETLHSRGIGMVIEKTSPETGITEFAKKATLVLCDRGYLRIQKAWRQYVTNHIACPLLQVESDVTVPVEIASGKEEYSAATLRRKLQPLIYQHVVLIPEETPQIDSTGMVKDSNDISDIDKTVSNLNIDHSIRTVSNYYGGTTEAKNRLDEFIDRKLDRYEDSRNDPNSNSLSNLSPYLHFGQISPIYIALQVSQHGGPGSDAFLEELIVRRELSMNFVHYNPQYDSFNGLPEWSKRTLREHTKDVREYVYSREDLEQGRTHDHYWNAAQTEMVTTGKMHGYMRMYWGKKILEWTEDPEEALATAVYLNNRYELDGRDANGFTGIAWCFGKHDRPWGSRPVFGNIRYMSAGGLKRKFDVDKYVRRYSTDSNASHL
jgi:deoxyribodipyrimidine photo-lyase